MPMPIHVAIEGETQGNITEGCCDITDREDTALVDEFSHEVEIPTNPQTGQPTGKRLHKPVRMVKLVDKCSPLLYKALSTGEKLTVTFQWWRQAGSAEEHYFSTKLEEAIAVKITEYFPNVYEDTTAKYEHMEAVEFTYKKIIWTHETESKEHEDDWTAPAT